VTFGMAIHKEVTVKWRVVYLHVVFKGCDQIGETVLRGPVHVFSLSACFGDWDVEDGDRISFTTV